MARTVAEIKKTMTDAFMADATIREKYGLKEVVHGTGASHL